MLSTRVPFLIVSVLIVTACGSSSGSKAADDTPRTTSTTAPAGPAMRSVTGMYGDRYCELLLVQPGAAGLRAQVYASYTLNECPQAAWDALDTAAIARSENVPIAQRNGPRYLLMDRVQKVVAPETVEKDFGGLRMRRLATVELGLSIAEAMKKYVPHAVDRETIFTFNAGRTVYELVAADGTRYVMQSWSQQIDPALAESGLATLGTRLQLPPGWKYETRTLTKPLQVVTVSTDAHVLQDDLMNSYSRETES